jgi:nucleoporin NUP82
MTRQLSKLDQIRARCAALGSGDGPSVLGERVARLASTQVALVSRIDRALQRLMDSHQPSISVYERRWFDELERIAADVGISRTSSGELKPDTHARKGIAAKTDRLAHQLALLRPQMDVLAGPPANERALLGADQLRKVENLLAAQATMLAEAKAKVANLNARMAQNPARQPSVAVDADLSIASIYSSPSGVPSGLPHSSTLANLASPSSFRSRTPSSFFA